MFLSIIRKILVKNSTVNCDIRATSARAAHLGAKSTYAKLYDMIMITFNQKSKLNVFRFCKQIPLLLDRKILSKLIINKNIIYN